MFCRIVNKLEWSTKTSKCKADKQCWMTYCTLHTHIITTIESHISEQKFILKDDWFKQKIM